MTQTLPADLLAACADGAPSPAQVLALRRVIAAWGAEASPRLLRHAAFGALSLPPLPAHGPGQTAADGGRAWLVLSAANGWRREAAVRVLDPPISGFEMTMLLERLGDWVREVRNGAEHRLVALAPAISPAVVAEVAVVLVLRIEGLRRLSPQARAAWEGLRARPEAHSAVVQALLHRQGARVKHITRQRLRDPALDGSLAQIALRAAHPGARAVALEAALGGAVVWHAGMRFDRATQSAMPDWRRRPLSVAVDAAGLAQAAVADRAAQVRKVLAEGLSRMDPLLAVPLAHRLAADRNAPVRLRAGFYLEKGTR